MIEIGWKTTSLIILCFAIPGLISGKTNHVIAGLLLGLWIMWPGFIGMYSDLLTNKDNLKMFTWIVFFNAALLFCGSGFFTNNSFRIIFGFVIVMMIVVIGLWIESGRPHITREDLQSSARSAK